MVGDPKKTSPSQTVRTAPSARLGYLYLHPSWPLPCWRGTTKHDSVHVLYSILWCFCFFWGQDFPPGLGLDLFFPWNVFFWVRRRPRAGHGLCHAEMSGCRVAVAPLASISWSACIFIETPVKHMETFRKDHWMKRQILEKLHHFSAFFPIFLLVEHRDSTDRSQRAPMSWGLDEFQGLPILRTREAQEIDKANSVATELDCSVIFGI